MDICIERVAEVPGECHISRWEMLRYGNRPEDIAVDLLARLEDDRVAEQLALKVGVAYTYMRSMVKRPLLRHTVEVVFAIPSIEDFVSFTPARDKIDISPSVISMMLGVAIGALRGMIAQKTTGTPLEGRPLPLVNISDLVSRLIYGDRPSRATIPLEQPAVC